MGGGCRRLFFALWPPTATREAIARVQSDAAASAGPRARPARVDNLHLTLAFLGAVPEASLAALSVAAGAVRGEIFMLQLSRLDRWRGGVLSLRPHTTPAPLAMLIGQLQAQLETVGFARDRRCVRPHITLARNSAQLPSQAPAVATVRWLVRDFVLCESVSAPGGVRYQVLARWALRSSPDRPDIGSAGDRIT